MFELSFMKILLVLVVVFVIFGAGKLPKVMADLGKGMRHFKNALNDNPPEDHAAAKIESSEEKKEVA